AMARSKPLPVFFMSPGARLTTMRHSPMSTPRCAIVLFTRTRLSRTAASASPTSSKNGGPRGGSAPPPTGGAGRTPSVALRAVANMIVSHPSETHARPRYAHRVGESSTETVRRRRAHVRGHPRDPHATSLPFEPPVRASRSKRRAEAVLGAEVNLAPVALLVDARAAGALRAGPAKLALAARRAERQRRRARARMARGGERRPLEIVTRLVANDDGRFPSRNIAAGALLPRTRAAAPP